MIGLAERRIRSCTGHVHLRAGAALLLFCCGIALAVSAFEPGKSTEATRRSEIFPGDDPLTLTIVLNRDDQHGFEQFLEGIKRTGSPSYRSFLKPREQAECFGPSVASYQA